MADPKTEALPGCVAFAKFGRITHVASHQEAGEALRVTEVFNAHLNTYMLVNRKQSYMFVDYNK